MKLFVIFHVVAITVWALPNPSKLISDGTVKPYGTQWLPYLNDKHLKALPPISVYLNVTGFWQYWDMFSPDPAQIDNWGDAFITYKNGTVKRYQYPRMFLLPIPDKYLTERYRKFFEHAGAKDYSFLWPTFALRIAQLNDNPKNPPVEVKLHLHALRILAPGIKQPTEYSDVTYFDYVVDQKLLEQARDGHH